MVTKVNIANIVAGAGVLIPLIGMFFAPDAVNGQVVTLVLGASIGYLFGSNGKTKAA